MPESLVNPWFLQVTGQTAESYGAALALKAYKAEQGITGGVTAGQLNASLGSSLLTTTKASYLNALLDSGALAPLQTAQVQQLLTPPRSVVTSSGMSGSSVSSTSGIVPTPARMSDGLALKRFRAANESRADSILVASSNLVFTVHGQERADGSRDGRYVPNLVIFNILENPIKVEPGRDNTTKYTGSGGYVIMGSGGIVTVVTW